VEAVAGNEAALRRSAARGLEDVDDGDSARRGQAGEDLVVRHDAGALRVRFAIARALWRDGVVGRRDDDDPV
jgi:hypothetical protein